MLLSSMTIEAVRGTAGLELEELRPVNLVVGANNAGKSTLLEAAGVLLRPQDPSNWVQTSKHRDETMSFLDGLWSLFPHTQALHLEDGALQTDAFQVNGKLGDYQREVHARASTRRVWSDEGGDDDGDDVVLTLDTKVKENGRSFKHTLEFKREIRALPGKAFSYRCFTLTPGAHRSSRVLLDYLNFVVEAGTKQEAIQLLRLFDPDIADLDISFNFRRPSVRVLHKTRGVVDLASFGDGLRRAALFGMALRRAEGGLLMIDEIEGGIHTRLLPQLLALLIQGAKTYNVQILATTHSLEALDAMLEATQEQPDLLAVYHLRRNDDDRIESLRFDWEKANKLREGGVDLR